MVEIVPASASSQDVSHLISAVAEVERSQRAEDVAAFLALFDQDAVWVTGGGQRLVGYDMIAEFTRRVLPGAMRDGTVTYQPRIVQFITLDVAVTGVDQEYLDLDGSPTTPPTLGRPTYVWIRRNAGWRIIVGQNTAVSP
jgi:uncharacterized protein (TIGR02246 family)